MKGKTVGFLGSIQDVKAGDLLLFVAQRGSRSNAIIMAANKAIKDDEQEHTEFTHAAICVGQDKDGYPEIMHVASHSGQEPLPDISRPMTVYRPADTMLAKEIVKVAGDYLQKTPHWSPYVAATVVLSSVFGHNHVAHPGQNHKPSKDEVLRTYTICSEFVSKIYVQSLTNLVREGRYTEQDSEELQLDIPTGNVPMVLEHELSKKPQLDKFKCIIRDPYMALKTEMLTQLDHIEKKLLAYAEKVESKDDSKAIANRDNLIRASICEKMLFDNIKKLDNHLKNGSINSLDASLKLLHTMMPKFKEIAVNAITGKHEYETIVRKSDSLGIFPTDYSMAAMVRVNSKIAAHETSRSR